MAEKDEEHAITMAEKDELHAITMDTMETLQSTLNHLLR
jgi:hypothetical protein